MEREEEKILKWRMNKERKINEFGRLYVSLYLAGENRGWLC
jgi:hypothetical protein